MIAVASGWIPKVRAASYHASGFMWFSGVTWSKWRNSRSAADPAVSRESIATPMLKSTVSLTGVMSSISGGARDSTTMSSTRKLAGVPLG